MGQSSPMKGGSSGFMGENNIAAIMAYAKEKGGMTMGSKDLKKLDQKGGIGSQTGKSQKSAGTRRTGFSRSRKSEYEDFDNMDIDEINGLVKQCEDAIIEANRGVKQINKKKTLTDLNKQKELEPFQTAIKQATFRQIILLKIIDVKTPFYEKMPKDNQFYKHYMNTLQLVNMSKMLSETVEQEKSIFKNAIAVIQEQE